MSLYKGDNSIIEKIYCNCRERVINNIAFRLSCDRQEAERLFQYSIAEFWKQVQDGKLTRLECDVEGWLCTVAKNRMINYRKRQRCHKAYCDHEKNNETGPVIFETVSFFDAEQTYTILSECMSELLPDDRRVLELHYFEKLGLDEVAKKMNLGNKETARKRIYRAGKRLKELIMEKKGNWE